MKDSYLITKLKDGTFTLVFYDDFNDRIIQNFTTLEKVFTEIKLHERLKEMEP